MARTEKELLNELYDLEELLRQALQTEGALLFLDLQFIASRSADIKKELRLAYARGD